MGNSTKLFQLRNFGTPLLVVGSGLTYALIFSSREIEINKFYAKRLKRLIFPAWIFLSFFFLFLYFASELIEKEYPFKLRQILTSYLFMNGIGFVWVFKIYLMLALITPIAISINRHVDSDRLYFGNLITLYTVYELLNFMVQPYLAGKIETVFNSIIFILIPYSLLYLYSFRMAALKSVNIIVLSLLSLVLFLSMTCIKYLQTGSFVPTQNFKYPPTIYYLSYAFFTINIVFLVFKRVKPTKKYIKKSISWLSSNSLWIYLWHIFAFYIWKFLAPAPAGDMALFLLKTTFLFSIGITLTILQNKLVSLVSMKSQIFKRKIAPLLSSNT